MSDPSQPPLKPPSLGPNKAFASIVAGAVSTLLVYIINQFVPHPLPAEIVASVQTLITTASVYFVPPGGV